MGENTAIEWAHHTFNPVIGCQKVSPGCDNCYAETQNAHRKWNGGTWGPGAPRKRTSISNWKEPLKWDRAAAAAGERHRVFCASLADVFDNQWEDGVRDDLWRLIALCQNLDFLLLTKRPQNIVGMLPPGTIGIPWPWPNVWLGTTAEDQKEYDRRWPHLAKVPAAVHFISYEPALGPLIPHSVPVGLNALRVPDWIIAGGESGGKARPPQPQWFEDIRDECQVLRIAFLFKQWGEWLPWGHFNDAGVVDHPEQTRYRTMEWENEGWRDVGFPMWCDSTDGAIDAEFCVARVGKKAAGRLLDGRTWDEFPVPREEKRSAA